MALKKLVNPGAFGQGADLWIIPDPKGSAWARKIDWYLNLQVIRAAHHVSQEISPVIQRILDENEIRLKPPKPVKKESPLLVSSHRHLPAQFVVRMPYRGKDEDWVEQCLEIWQQLKSSTLRVFLPTKIDGAVLEKLWPSDRQNGVSYVTDSSPIEA